MGLVSDLMNARSLERGGLTSPQISFVTACDFQRLPQALALFESLVRHYSGDFELWVWSEDLETHEVIDYLGEPNIRSLYSLDLSPEEERSFWAKPRNQRYWYASAASILTLLRCQESRTFIYVDADVWMLKSIDQLLASFAHSDASVFLTPHDFDPKYNRTDSVGRFCVQFMPFKKSPESRTIAEDWLRDCLKLPGSYSMTNDYGDQKILDSWESRYGKAVTCGVRPGTFMGPWNARVFPLSSASAYHFQGFRLMSRDRAFLGEYLLPKNLLPDLYRPYLEACAKHCRRIEALGPDLPMFFASAPRGIEAVRSRLRLLRRAGRRYIANPFMRLGIRKYVDLAPQTHCGSAQGYARRSSE